MSERVLVSAHRTESGTVCAQDVAGAQQPRSAPAEVSVSCRLPHPGPGHRGCHLQAACQATGIRRGLLQTIRPTPTGATQVEHHGGKSPQRTERGRAETAAEWGLSHVTGLVHGHSESDTCHTRLSTVLAKNPEALNIASKRRGGFFVMLSSVYSN